MDQIRSSTFWDADAEGAGEGEGAGVVVSEWETVVPSGALTDTLGISGTLTLALVDADDPGVGAAAAAGATEGRFLRAPGGT